MLRALICLVAAAGAASVGACASTTATLYALDGKWPMSTTSLENREWIEGLPSEERVVEARLESPPIALCENVRHEPPARETRHTYGLDGIGRFFYGFMGVTEIGVATALQFAAQETDDGCPGCMAGTVFFGLDGIASLVMAFLIPDTHYETVRIVPPVNIISDVCPSDVRFEVAGRAFPVGPDGQLTPEHGRSLMNAAVETGSAIALRFGDEVRWSTVPPELRCAWAVELGSALAPALCPHARLDTVIRAP